MSGLSKSFGKRCSQDEFIAMLQGAGLDPAQYDVPELHAAWLLLDSHMQRLRVPSNVDTDCTDVLHGARQPGVQPLSIFNPHDVTRTPNKGDA